MATPGAFFKSFDPHRPGWDISLGRPAAARMARRPSEVPAVIDFAEAAVKKGFWAALLVSYEAAPAFDSHLATRPPSEFPLAWAGVYRRPLSPAAPSRPYRHSPWKPALTGRGYGRKLDEVRRRISRGETYQANFTFPLSCRWSGNPWSWFMDLAASQAAPYSAYIDLGRWKVLSLSPELFFQTQGSRIEMRPMKGSMARGETKTADRARAQALVRGAKDRAENLMIVDLLRNDLGKISRPGSVQVERLFELETYPTVHQMTSRLRSRLLPCTGLNEIFTALFPSGSVTGAPKVRTMDILRRLESQARGIYTGAIGLGGAGQPWTFSVAIRTLTLDQHTHRAACPVGSGITWASRADPEYDECLLKGKFLEPPAFELLESLRLEAGQWFLLEDHLRRMAASAARWQFVWDQARARRVLEDLRAAHPRGLWKARLQLARNGQFSVQSEPLAPPRPWRVALAKEPLPWTPWLGHKTTRRQAYQRQRDLRPGADDVLLWNPQGELTESTMANLVVVKGGKWWTPALRSGLLPGVYRERLLAGGSLRERLLRPPDLRSADNLFLVNSVRRWIPVRLMG